MTGESDRKKRHASEVVPEMARLTIAGGGKHKKTKKEKRAEGPKDK